LRIERAKRLLANSNEKIEALAEMCGYQSANSLSVAFKNTTGMSPKQFREKMRPRRSGDERAAKRNSPE
jgi:AraC-like DNA-binding protein